MCKYKFRKEFVLTLAALIMATSLGGCTNESVSQPTEATETIESISVSDDTKDQESSAQSSSSEIATSESKIEEKKEPFVSDRSAAFELLSNITIGWNLGNTLDAHGAGASLLSETRWGNPKTTQEMMDAVAAQGFNAVRIPVTYAEHVGKAPDYKINDAWLDRVQETVDYAINAGLYVLLDTHHEPDYWLKPDEAHEEACVAELTAIWTQVAECFRDYDTKLIFEGMNEPRIKGSSAEWNGGTAEERKVVDHLNQAFIDAVRSTGGNNETRLLVICTYGNNPGYNIIKEFKIPEDNYIAVAVHMYTPYYFTYDGEGSQFYDTWDGSEKSSISSTMKQIDKYFIKNDLPVIVTEFGAVNKGKPEEVIKWATDYLSVMNNYGVKCFWWDNNIYNTNGEKFGIFNRRELSWFDQKLADALVSAATAE